ncbi:MAG: J domain-containing protein [Coriobacteriales bacterium]|jgi:hypothetical protein|nr:J domain-containing protein [Coriobacteriales bacterium]
MTRDEALRILGLKEGATEADIKLAYKEMAQILHPDKFADNKKLQDRATEQFKQVNQAREVLASGKSSRGEARARSSSSRPASAAAGYSGGSDTAAGLRARLAGIAAVRVQLVAQLDAELDSRKVGFYLVGGGILATLLGRLIKPLLALGPTAIVWGAVQVVRAQASIGAINKHLEDMEQQRKAIEKKLEKL